MTDTEERPPLPPFTRDSASHKVRLAEDGWNSHDPARVAAAYSTDCAWRNRAEFPSGRQEIIQFLRRKWARELDYRLIKELWAFNDERIAVRFAYEWHDDSGQWYRCYGNENWAFRAVGRMIQRYASISDLPILDHERHFFLAIRASTGRPPWAERPRPLAVHFSRRPGLAPTQLTPFASLRAQTPHRLYAPGRTWPDGAAVSASNESPVGAPDSPQVLEERHRWIWATLAHLLATSESGPRGSLPLKEVLAGLARVGVAERDEICAIVHWSMARGFLIESRNPRGQFTLMLTTLGFHELAVGGARGLE